jgi:hypothetical protein
LKLIEHVPTQKEIVVATIDEAKSFYPRFDGFRFNYVISANKTAINSDQISSNIDRFILRTIRSQADLIVSTGLTARTENLKASSYAPLLLLTQREALDCDATRVASEQMVYVTCDEDTFSNPNALAVGKTSEPLTVWLEEFACKHSAKSVVIECGLSLTRTLLTSPLAKEFCLSVTEANNMTLAKETAERFLNELGVKATVIQLLESEDTYLFRFDLRSKTF